jgi:hypothetical protein
MPAIWYKTKPELKFQALIWDGENLQEVKDFLGDSFDSHEAVRCLNGASTVRIKTLEGIMTAQRGDYIVRGFKGEFYPCTPSVFELKYEPVN